MTVLIPSISLHGQQGSVVHVECRLTRGLPAMVVVGMASRSVHEAKERIRGAFAASRLRFPPRRIIINLAPADLPKSGTAFDAALAAGILLADQPECRVAPRTLILGELGLDGQLKPIRGLIGSLLSARSHGLTTVYLPALQHRQAAIIPGLTLIPVQSLGELHRDLAGISPLPRLATANGYLPKASAVSNQVDFQQISGQARCRRAAEIAAAGGHHLLLSGPPGTGKSLIASALPSILPPLTQDALLEVNRLHGLTGTLDSLISTPPFRAPHHSASRSAIIGGGNPPGPGEISLSHQGVLLLDELPEFARSTIEALRQPLEAKTITMARAPYTTTFPAHFLLVATANPCPCGFAGSSQPCQCTPGVIAAYRQKLSGPLLDRLDLHLEAEPIDHAQLLVQNANETSALIRERVIAARQRQADRQGSTLNADLDNTQLQQTCRLRPEARQLLDTAAARLQLSARGYLRTVKVARTIADLAGAALITPDHLAEALQYRARQNP